MRFRRALWLLACLSITSLARATPDGHVPRAYGATLGGTYAFRNQLPTGRSGREAPAWGAQVGVRFGWQVSGLDGSAPGTVGVEMDFLAQPGPGGARDSYGLLYGLFMKHAFGNQLKLRPFLSYGLGAAQVWVAEVRGRGIGHATRLGFGLERRLRDRLHVSLGLAYQGVLMPRFALAGERAQNTSFHAGLVTLGVWHGN